MRILVTGCAGFVGSHIADLLLAEGHEVLGIDDHSSGVNYTPDRCKRWELTLGGGHRPLLRAALRGVDAIAHCAAYAQLRKWTDSEAERHRLRESNVDATMALLEDAPAVPIVYLGTASVYGSQPGHLFVEGEESPETCESWYAATKLAGEHLVAAWARWRGVPWHVARLVNVVGARTHRGVIADFVRMHRETGTVHAADDGSQRKSWVHVADVAGAVSAMLGGGVPSGVYNVTSGERWSWRDIIRIMGVTGVTCEARRTGAVGDPEDLAVSGQKLWPYYQCEREIAPGVREALASLGWEARAA